MSLPRRDGLTRAWPVRRATRTHRRPDVVSGQEGRTQDHARPEAFVHLTLEATVVVGQRIEGEVFHQMVETDRNGRRPFQIGSLNRGIELEGTSGFTEFTSDIFRRNSLDADAQVVELEYFHMPAEHGWDHRQVGGD